MLFKLFCVGHSLHSQSIAGRIWSIYRLSSYAQRAWGLTGVLLPWSTGGQNGRIPQTPQSGGSLPGSIGGTMDLSPGGLLSAMTGVSSSQGSLMSPTPEVPPFPWPQPVLYLHFEPFAAGLPACAADISGGAFLYFQYYCHDLCASVLPCEQQALPKQKQIRVLL